MSSTSSSASDSSRASSPVVVSPGKRKRPSSNDSDSNSSDAEADDKSPEETVLSHAEKRRQKKREKTSNDEPPAKKPKLDVSKKRQHSVWVGNLSFKTTEDALRQFFDGVGEITRVNLPLKPGTNPAQKSECRGFAYVDFATSDAKVTAITLSEKNLLGRKLLIKDGDDFAGRPAAPAVEGADDNKPTAPKTHSKTAQKILRAQTQPPGPTLFLGNLGFETTDESIRQLFNAHRFPNKAKADEPKEKEPWIRKVRLGTFEDSGACKGFGFVDFASAEHATSALINIKNHFLDGRKLKVEFASADAVRRGASKPKIPREQREERAPRREFSKPRQPSRPRVEQVHEDAAEEDGSGQPEAVAYQEPRIQAERPSRPMRGRGGGRDTGNRSRPRPGAALAEAQRQSAAIIANTTTTRKKITF